MRALLFGLILACGLTAAHSAGTLEKTFAWDNVAQCSAGNAPGCWPAGTTVELNVNGVGATGLDGKTMPAGQHTLSFPIQPGGRMDAKARAVTPSGYQCGDPPVACPYSEWATLSLTLPLDPTNLWVTVKGTAASAPVFAGHYPTAFNSSVTPKTALNAVPVAGGDAIVMLVAGESNGGTLGATENGAGTLVAGPAIDLPNYAETLAFSYVAPAAETLTAAFANSGAALFFGGSAVRFSGSSGIGASAKASGSAGFPAVSLTTTRANSALVVISGDYNAIGGAQTFTADGGAGIPTVLANFPGDTSHYGVAIAYYSDSGAAGPKTVGMSAPPGQAWAIIAIEVLGK